MLTPSASPCASRRPPSPRRWCRSKAHQGRTPREGLRSIDFLVGDPLDDSARWRETRGMRNPAPPAPCLSIYSVRRYTRPDRPRSTLFRGVFDRFWPSLSRCGYGFDGVDQIWAGSTKSEHLSTKSAVASAKFQTNQLKSSSLRPTSRRVRPNLLFSANSGACSAEFGPLWGVHGQFWHGVNRIWTCSTKIRAS